MRAVRASVGASVLCLLSLLSGCVSDVIVPQYASYSGCPEDKIAVDSNGPNGSHRASGCGNSVTFVCLDEGTCKSPAIVVAERHAKQFSCTPKEAEVEDLGNDAYVAKGCGQAMTYQCFRDPEHVVRCIVETAERKAGGYD